MSQSGRFFLAAMATATLLAGRSALAAGPADALTIGSVTVQPGDTVSVPLFVRDVAGTPLGGDRSAFIQRIQFKVNFAPAGRISGCANPTFPDCAVEFIPAGLLAGRTPVTADVVKNLGSIAVNYAYDRTTDRIPYNQLAADPGDLVGFLKFVTSSALQTEAIVALSFDSTDDATAFADDTAAITETVAADTLRVVNGSIHLSPVAPADSCPALPGAGNLSINWQGSSGCTTTSSSCTTNDPIQFTAATFGYTIASCDSVAWAFGDGINGTGTSPRHVYTSTGTYNVSLTLANRNGSFTVTKTINVTTVATPPTPPIGCTTPTANNVLITWSAPSGCSSISGNCQAQEIVTFTAQFFNYTVCTTPTFIWTFGDDTAGNGKTVNHTYAAPGTYPVLLRFTDGGSILDLQTSITISPAAVTTCALGCVVVAPASVVTMTSAGFSAPSAAASCPSAVYSWSFGDGAVLTTGAAPVTHSYGTPGTYTWNLTVQPGGAACSQSGTITVLPVPPRRRSSRS